MSLYRHVIRDLILPTYGRAALGNVAPGRKREGTVSVKRRAWRRERPASIKKRFGSHEITQAFYRASSIFVPLSGPRRWTDRRALPPWSPARPWRDETHLAVSYLKFNSFCFCPGVRNGAADKGETCANIPGVGYMKLLSNLAFWAVQDQRSDAAIRRFLDSYKIPSLVWGILLGGWGISTTLSPHDRRH